MEVLKTKNYDLFQTVISNREVDDRHVNKLADSIRKKNLLAIKPIIVDENMRVIDGQHRLEAAEKLGVEIHYVISGSVTKDDISALNSVQKNWKAEDYLNYYTLEGVPEYVELSQFLNKYPLIKISTALIMMNTSWTRDLLGFKNGHINVGNKEKAYLLANYLNQLRNIGIEFAFSVKFIAALRRAVDAEGFEFDTLLKKIQQNLRGFVPCVNATMYCEMIEEFYNYRSSKNIINLRKTK